MFYSFFSIKNKSMKSLVNSEIKALIGYDKRSLSVRETDNSDYELINFFNYHFPAAK